MVFFQMMSGNSTEVLAGYFWPRFEPYDYSFDDIFGGRFSLALWAAYAEASGEDARVKFSRIKTFRWASASLFNDVDSQAHIISPRLRQLSR